MPAWLIALLPVLISYYGPAALTALGALVSYLIHRYVKNQKTVDAFDWLRAHIGPVVAAVEQTYVDAVTKSGDLALTPAQQQEALSRALKAVLDQIPPDYLAILRQAFPAPGQLESYITTLIEGEVKQMSIAKGPSAADVKNAFNAIPGLTNEKTGVP